MTNVFANMSPDDVIQAPPSVCIVINASRYHTRSPRKASVIEPVAVLAASGPTHKIPRQRVGSWNLELMTNRELLACLIDPAEWVHAKRLDLHVYPLGADLPFEACSSLPRRSGYADPQPIWSPVTTLGPRTLSDGTRGVRMSYDGDTLTMNWFHVQKYAVMTGFSKALTVARPYWELVLEAGCHEQQTQWYNAPPTRFRLS